MHGPGVFGVYRCTDVTEQMEAILNPDIGSLFCPCPGGTGWHFDHSTISSIPQGGSLFRHCAYIYFLLFYRLICFEIPDIIDWKGCSRCPTKANISFVSWGSRGQGVAVPIWKKNTVHKGLGEKDKGSNMVTQFCTRKDKGTRFSRFSAGWTRQTTQGKPCCGRQMPKRIVCHIWTAENTNGIHMGDPIEATRQGLRVPRLHMCAVAWKLSF